MYSARWLVVCQDVPGRMVNVIEVSNLNTCWSFHIQVIFSFHRRMREQQTENIAIHAYDHEIVICTLHSYIKYLNYMLSTPAGSIKFQNVAQHNFYIETCQLFSAATPLQFLIRLLHILNAFINYFYLNLNSACVALYSYMCSHVA